MAAALWTGVNTRGGMLVEDGGGSRQRDERVWNLTVELRGRYGLMLSGDTGHHEIPAVQGPNSLSFHCPSSMVQVSPGAKQIPIFSVAPSEVFAKLISTTQGLLRPFLQFHSVKCNAPYDV